MLLTAHVAVASIAPALLELVHVGDLEQLELDPVVAIKLLFLICLSLLSELLVHFSVNLVDFVALVFNLPLRLHDLVLHFAVIVEHFHDVLLNLLIVF